MKTILTALLLSCVAILAQAQNYFFDTTLKSNNKPLHISTREYNDDTVLLTVTCGIHTALKDSIDKSGLADIQFPDFDKNGFSDILLSYMGNNTTYLLYLFDPKANQFRKIVDFMRYPAAIQLKSDSRYFYSYHKAGCADLDWISDLFKIVDFKIIEQAHILGLGCDFEVDKTPQAIKVYKTIGNNREERKLWATLPYLKYIPEHGDKWNFIEKYWNENYQKFD